MPRDAALPPAPLTAPLDRGPLDWINPAGGFDHRGRPLDPRVAEWAAHVATGRIGHTPPSDPAIVANREATARLFARPRRPPVTAAPPSAPARTRTRTRRGATFATFAYLPGTGRGA